MNEPEPTHEPETPGIEHWTIYEVVTGTIRAAGSGPVGIAALQSLGEGEELLVGPRSHPSVHRVAPALHPDAAPRLQDL